MVILKCQRMGNYAYTPEEALDYSETLYKLIEKGVMKVKIFKEYPFTAEGVKAAHTDLASGRTVGKLIIRV